MKASKVLQHLEIQVLTICRVSLYLAGLLYSFLAVFMVADIFMCSIEAITSATKRVLIPQEDGGLEEIEVPIWNGSLANLLLMSLGPRSAPEIILTIVGITSNGFSNDPLGSNLIVGSGMFNNMVIAAISIICIPAGQVRRIENIPVFLVTVFFSLFAYVWLLIILTAITPQKVLSSSLF